MQQYLEKPKRGAAETQHGSNDVYTASTFFSFNVNCSPDECAARLQAQERTGILWKLFAGFTEVEIVTAYTASYRFHIRRNPYRRSLLIAQGDILRNSDDSALIVGTVKSGSVFGALGTAVFGLIVSFFLGISWHLSTITTGALAIFLIGFTLILASRIFYVERRDFIIWFRDVLLGDETTYPKKKKR